MPSICQQVAEVQKTYVIFNLLKFRGEKIDKDVRCTISILLTIYITVCLRTTHHHPPLSSLRYIQLADLVIAEVKLPSVVLNNTAVLLLLVSGNSYYYLL